MDIFVSAASVAAADALRLLLSTRTNDRLRAARLLAETEDDSAIDAVKRARSTESDSWVQSALDRVLERWRNRRADYELGQAWITEPEDKDLEDVRAQAIQRVSQTLLHEIRPMVGQIDVAARKELGTAHGASETANAVARLRRFLDTVARLEQAAASPKIGEFDLSDFVHQTISDTFGDENRISTARSDVLVVSGDSELVGLAFVNALKNAVEASRPDDGPVVVNWGRTAEQVWIVVLDEGVGLPAGSDKVYQAGKTTKNKSEHFGWGLSIAQRAMHSLGGSISLRPREERGTSCEIRWFESEGGTREDSGS